MAKETVAKTSTKNEIYDAYESLLKKVSESEKMKPQEIKEREEKVAVVKKAAELSPESIIHTIANLKIKVSDAFDQVEDALLAEQKKLADIQQAIVIQKEMIDELYQVKITADSLAAMLLAHKEKKLQMEVETNEVKAELDRRKAEFDTDMSLKKVEWEREKARILADLKEEKERAKKEHQREEEEYAYSLALKRRKEEDEYQEKRKKAEFDFSSRVAARDKELHERESAVAQREQETAVLSAKVARFDEDLAKSVKDAEKIVAEKLKSQFGFEKELLLAEHDGLIKLKEQTIQTLENRIKEQEGYVKQLSLKTDQADKSVKDIAMKAIESASKVQMFDPPAVRKGQE
jgi:hypothetical protein